MFNCFVQIDAEPGAIETANLMRAVLHKHTKHVKLIDRGFRITVLGGFNSRENAEVASREIEERFK